MFALVAADYGVMRAIFLKSLYLEVQKMKKLFSMMILVFAITIGLQFADESTAFAKKAVSIVLCK